MGDTNISSRQSTQGPEKTQGNSFINLASKIKEKLSSDFSDSSKPQTPANPLDGRTAATSQQPQQEAPTSQQPQYYSQWMNQPAQTQRPYGDAYSGISIPINETLNLKPKEEALTQGQISSVSICIGEGEKEYVVKSFSTEDPSELIDSFSGFRAAFAQQTAKPTTAEGYIRDIISRNLVSCSVSKKLFELSGTEGHDPIVP